MKMTVTRRLQEVVTEAKARATDPWTSWEAAKSVSGTGKTKAEVLFVLRRNGPMTDEKLCQLVRSAFGPMHSDSGIRSRRAELVDDGHVRDSGRVGRTARGRRSIMWEATPDA